MTTFGEAVFDSEDDDEYIDDKADLSSDDQSDYSEHNGAKLQEETSSGFLRASMTLQKWNQESRQKSLVKQTIKDPDIFIGSCKGMQEYQKKAAPLKSKTNSSWNELQVYLKTCSGLGCNETFVNPRRDNGSIIDKRFLDAAQAALRENDKEKIVLEQVLFGGRSIEIEKKVIEGSKADKAIQKKARVRIGHETSAELDKMIEDVQGEKVINTVEKSIADWETHKRATGEEDLRSREKGFLEKQAFLQKTADRETDNIIQRRSKR